MTERNCSVEILVRRTSVCLLGLYLGAACSSDRPDFPRSETDGLDAAADAHDNTHALDAGGTERDAFSSTAANGTSTDTESDAHDTFGVASSNEPDQLSDEDADSATSPNDSSTNDALTSSTGEPQDAGTGGTDATSTQVGASTTDSSTTDSRTNDALSSSMGEPQDAGTGDTDATSTHVGSSTDAGCEDNEDCDDSLLCAPNGECVECLTESERRDGTTACGLNGAGVLEQECVGGLWVDDTACVDPDECENGTTSTCEARFDALGECALRTITCTNGTYDASECEGQEELCGPDGIDEDCDGEINEAPCETYTSLATADGHVCALTSLERVLCWGSNVFGQTGSADGGNVTTPTAVFGMTNVRSVAVSNTSSCAVFNDDSARCWGSNDNGELGDGTTNSPGAGAIVVVDVVSGIAQLLPGRNRACAVLTDGTVECWADDPDPTATAQVMNLSDVVAADVAPEGGRFCALIEGGSVRCWDTFDDSAFAISGVTDAVQIDVGDIEACALLSDGTVSCWTGTAASDVGLTSVVHVDSGRDWSCAVRTNGRVYCWGDFYGTTPVEIEGIDNATAVSVGFSYACVLKADATASCFGKNIQAQLGNPDTQCCSLDVLETRFPPVLVAGP